VREDLVLLLSLETEWLAILQALPQGWYSTMKNVRLQLGWLLCVIALGTFAVFTLAFTITRFQNETWTETQLMLWSLARWWGWVPAIAVGGIGFWLVYRESR